MPTFSILQLGDIHYPLYKGLIDVDDKLHASPAVLKGVGINRLATVIKYITQLNKSMKINFAAFVGDFTDAGNRDEFERSLEYFSTVFSPLGIPAYGVPGNHDLDWINILTKDVSKFSNFQQIANLYRGKLELSFDNLKVYELHSSVGKFALYAFNSCLGCADIWKLSRLYEVDIESHIKALGDQNLFQRFDAPYIDQESISDACQSILENPNVTPIILAHHNILPQRTPRIAVFPEMLNAGYVRNELKRLGRPIIYLHGHIHDSLVESLLADEDDGGQVSLVAVSAPLLYEGFNHVQLFMSEDCVPLGVQIDEYRFEGGGIARSRRKKIMFYDTKKRNILLDEMGKDIIKDLQKATEVPFVELASRFSSDKIIDMEFSGHLFIKRTVEFNQKTWRVSCT